MNPLLQKYLQAKAQAVQKTVGQFAQNAQQFAPQAFKAVTNPVGFAQQQVMQHPQFKPTVAKIGQLAQKMPDMKGDQRLNTQVNTPFGSFTYNPQDLQLGNLAYNLGVSQPIQSYGRTLDRYGQNKLFQGGWLNAGEDALNIAANPLATKVASPIIKSAGKLTMQGLNAAGQAGKIQLGPKAKQIVGEAKKFKVASQKGSVDVDGTPIQIHKDLKTFLSKDENGNWTVNEEATGRMLSGGGYPTPKHAIEAAKQLIDNFGIEKVQQRISDLSSSRMGTNKLMTKAQQVIETGSKKAQKTLQTPTKLLKQEAGRLVSSAQDALPTGQMVQSSKPPTGVQVASSLDQSVSQTGKRPPQTLNANRLDMDAQGRKMVEEITADKLKTVMSNKEIVELAKRSGFDTKSHSFDDQAERLAQELNSRRQVVEAEKAFRNLQASGASEDELMNAFANLQAKGIHARQGRTEVARAFQAGNIMATDINTPMQQVLKLMDDMGVNPEAYKKDVIRVNWDDANQVVAFYRKYVPAKWQEWLDVLRYNSMLSSPLTHITNMFGNAMNSGVVAPIEKTIAGGLDFLASSMTGKPRTQFAGEGAAYAKGYASNISKAAHAFADVMRGTKLSQNMDMRSLPLAVEGTNGKIATKLSYPTRLLEATDQFFTALTEGAETAALKYRQAKGGKVGNIAAQSKANAAYRVFRGELNDPRQGKLLNAIDELTGSIMKVRNSKNPWLSIPAKFTLPFVKTPMNILKQGIEYSPVGLATLPGAANKTEQLSKVVIGVSAMAATAMMTASGRTTWAEPTDEKKRAAFRAAGMQPYAVKIGDNWVSYTKLPPALSFPIAMVAAFHDAQENKLITDSELDKWLSAIAKTGNFFADQSYMKNIGDLVATAKGDAESMTRFVSNYPQQLVPYRALFSWMGRITDPLQRKVDRNASWYDQQVQQLMMQLPFLSMQVPARMDQFGQPVQNMNKEFNAFSPLRTTTEQPEEKEIYDLMETKTRMTRDRNAIKESLERGVVPDVLVASANETQMQPEFEGSMVSNPLAPPVSTAMSPAQQMMQDQKIAIIKDKLQYGGNITPEEKQLVLTNPQQPQLSGDEGIDKQLISDFNSELTAKSKLAGDMYKAGALSKEEASKYIAQFTTAKISTKDEKKAQKAEMDAQYSLDADMLKRNKDTQGWITTTEAYVKQLEEYKATLTDRTDQIRVQNRINDLTTQLGKYKGQGGFSKGKKLKGKILKLKLPKSRKIKTRRVKLAQLKFGKPKESKKEEIYISTI